MATKLKLKFPDLIGKKERLINITTSGDDTDKVKINVSKWMTRKRARKLF